MSEEQITALIAKLDADAAFQEKLKGATDLDAVAAILQNVGLEVNKDALLELASQKLELSDEELENAAGGCTPAFVGGVGIGAVVGGLIGAGVIYFTKD